MIFGPSYITVCYFPVLVRAFWCEGKVNEAVEAVRDMEQRGVVGTGSVYYELACCLCNNGRWQDALVEVSVFVYGVWIYCDWLYLFRCGILTMSDSICKESSVACISPVLFSFQSLPAIWLIYCNIGALSYKSYMFVSPINALQSIKN